MFFEIKTAVSKLRRRLKPIGRDASAISWGRCPSPGVVPGSARSGAPGWLLGSIMP